MGTNADDSEWIVLEQNDWSNLVVFIQIECPTPSILVNFSVDMSSVGQPNIRELIMTML